MFHPPEEILRDAARGEFLRRLHKLTDENSVCFEPLLPSREVEERLLRIACIAGNDHFKFRGVGWATATRIALDTDSETHVSSTDAVHALATAVISSVRFLGQLTVEEAADRIWASRSMFLDPIVFNPAVGVQQHLSGKDAGGDGETVNGEWCSLSIHYPREVSACDYIVYAI